ncbi:hypothetical protein P8452_56099 [Trifolium repens]|nr:hypothetical protein P8452_56099 [Trifolium repens]
MMRLCFSFLCVLVLSSYAVAYDPKDPNGNITVKWDVISWTSDGYVALVTINNFQKFRQIKNLGWTLGWSWAKKEIIWDMLGAQNKETVLGGVIAAWGQSVFEVIVGEAGTSNKTVRLPKNFTLLAPGPGYICGPTKIVSSSIFLSHDRRHKAQAYMTWDVTCKYSQG